jgi:hypothetical protein
MRFLERFRKQPPSGEAAGPASSEGASGAGNGPPIPGYDRLDAKEVGARLRELSQVELAAVETYERSHKERPVVLDKLRYMRTSEPLPGYDDLSPEQIGAGLVDADAQTVKAVRDYERKFSRRSQVLAETARVLPTSRASAAEDRSREEKSARLAEGYAVRKKTGEGL